MANYIFETTTDGSEFTSDDRLIFTSATASMVGATDNPATTTGLGTTVESITLSANDHSVTFAASQLSAASNDGHLIFLNGDSMVLGTHGNEALTITDPGHGHGTVVYGFDGNDTISGTSTANDTINGGAGDDHITGSSSYMDAGGHFVENDYYQGGAGNDTIVGGMGNDHIYGNVAIGAAGTADGNDVISAGAGNDYVNGNAGNDFIQGEDGNDRLFGGSGNDTIDGGNGNDSLQGNLGDDSLFGGNGNDTIHGGGDDDSIGGGSGNDQLWGDLGNDRIFGDVGNDTIHGGAGIDTVEGGAGNDLFTFSAGDASSADLANGIDRIIDFQDGTDHLSLGFTVSAVLHGQTGITFTSDEAAMTYAQGLLSASTGTHGTEVAAITVGTHTLLFWDDTHTSATINSALYLDNNVDANFNVSGNHADFV